MSPKKQKGQGLIEVLITAVIMLGCIITLMRFQSGLAYSDSVTQQQSQATILALSELETLRDYDVLNPQVPYTAYSSIASGTSSSVGTNTTYTLTWTVTTTASPSYKNLNITVSWTDRRNVAQSISLITQVAGIDPTYSSTAMY